MVEAWKGTNPNEMRALRPSDVVAGAGFEPATAPREAHHAPSLGYEFNRVVTRPFVSSLYVLLSTAFYRLFRTYCTLTAPRFLPGKLDNATVGLQTLDLLLGVRLPVSHPLNPIV